ncbi:MAG: type II toxin-antitoxin system PemK/MazF family toxin [Anaerolineales bacterium]|nr:type II toxin-antitoxin system PemK/MazF family toxin [Anaerolineales bacterium]
MKKPGQVALMSFPQVDLMPGKRRPVLLIAPVPGPYEDWLVCMFSTKLQQALPGFDEIINSNASDFHSSGLEVPSVIRVARLAVVSADMLIGTIGEISDERLHRIQKTLADWIQTAA